jgi:hypothetical protein
MTEATNPASSASMLFPLNFRPNFLLLMPLAPVTAPKEERQCTYTMPNHVTLPYLSNINFRYDGREVRWFKNWNWKHDGLQIRKKHRHKQTNTQTE